MAITKLQKAFILSIDPFAINLRREGNELKWDRPNDMAIYSTIMPPESEMRQFMQDQKALRMSGCGRVRKSKSSAPLMAGLGATKKGSTLRKGTKVYYAGGEGEHVPGYGKIVEKVPYTKYRPTSFHIKMDDGRIYRFVADYLFRPHVGRKWMTKKEYDAERKAGLKRWEETIKKMRAKKMAPFMGGLGITPTRTIKCPGGVRLEVYGAGAQHFAEKFYPAWLDTKISGKKPYLYDIFHKDSFRHVEPKKGPGKLYACPRSKWAVGKCRVSQVMLQMFHPIKDLKRYFMDGRSGKLGKRRKYLVNRAQSAVLAEGKRYRKVAGMAGLKG